MPLFKKDTLIAISSGTIAKAIIIGLLFYLLYFLRDVFLVVLTSIVIASAIEPITKWLVEKKIPRAISVIGIYAFLAIIFSGTVYYFLPPLFNQFSNYMDDLPKYVQYVELWIPFSDSQITSSSNTVSDLSNQFARGSFASNFSELLTKSSEGFVRIISTVFGGIFSFILIVIISFYLAVQKDGIEHFLKIVTPLKHERYIIDLWRRSQLKIGYWMQGQLLLMVIVAVLVFLGLTILGIKHALLLAVLAALFELIPVFGPILAAIPAVLVGINISGFTTGLVIAGLYLIIQQFENHLIYPLVVRKIVGISPILVILALVIGAKLAGFLGLILAVPVAAALIEYLNDLQRQKMEEELKQKSA